MRHRVGRKCHLCGDRIHPLRLLALPGVRTCTGCSDERKVTDRDVEVDGAATEEQVASAHRGDSRHD